MSADTGNISFWLSVFFILITLCGIFAIYSVVRKKSIEPENIDKLIDLGKWFVVSVAITLSTSIVNDGFREREQDIKEMDVFDKYTSVILEAEGVEKRRLLSEYFASVSPEGPIKKSWEEYKVVVDGHVAELKEVEAKALKIAEMAEKGDASKSDIEERNRLIEKAATLNQSLLSESNRTSLKPRIYFHIRDDSQRTKAKQLASEIALRANVVVPGIQRLDIGPSVSELRYFKGTEEQEAKQISEILSSLGLNVGTKYVLGYESSTNIRPRHYELWISDKDL